MELSTSPARARRHVYEDVAETDAAVPPGWGVDDPDAMTDHELHAIVDAEISDAVNYIDSEIGPQRADAVDAYFGRLMEGDDELDGRSKVISRDVHDTIQSILPSVMRIFFGPEHVVEFEPDDDSENDLQMAEQATDYVGYVVTRDNDGFNILLSTFKNALREKVGIVKFWWDTSVKVTTKTYTGMTEDTLTALMSDMDKAISAEVIEVSEDETEKDEDGSPLLSATIKMKVKNERIRLEAVPPEEFIIGRRLKDLDDEGLVAHRSMKTVSELVAMGYDRVVVESQSDSGDELGFSEERIAREGASFEFGGSSGSDRSQRLVLYVEAYINVDYDGDGIAELRKVCTVGPGHKIILNEPADRRPFADFQCDPEPHTFFGQSLADKTIDIQRVKSNVWRGAMDSLAQSIFPRMVVVDGDGHMEDALNTENGALLRAKTANGYVPLATPFVGGAAFPMLTYMDEVRENRTGMSKVSQGLDAEALQNTTAAAAEGQFSKSQDRIDLLARVLASGMKRMFQGILHLLVENQRSTRKLKLGSKGWVPMDPRGWKADMDVIVNVGLGGGSDDAKVATLMGVAATQKEIIVQYGIDNPIVGIQEFRNTQTKILELRGFKNHGQFYKEIPPIDPNAPPAPKPPTPEQQAAEAQMQERAGRFKMDMDRLHNEIEDRKRTQDREDARAQYEAQMAAAELEQNGALKLAEINARYKTTIDAATINAQAAALKIQADLDIQQSEARNGAPDADEPVEGDL